MWGIMNRGRRKRRRVNENIEEREWKDYFMRLLGGVEHRVMRENWDRRRQDGEGEMSKEEIRGTIRRLKDGKAGGIPGEMEIWRERFGRLGVELLQRGVEGRGMVGGMEGEGNCTNCEERRRKDSGGI